MTKTFSFETPVNDGKTFIGNLLISGTTESVKDYEIDDIMYTPEEQWTPCSILPLIKYLGRTMQLTHIPVTAHLIKLWGCEEPEAFVNV